MSQWPTARPPKKTEPKRERAPRKVRTHVFLDAGSKDFDDTPLCADCGHRRDRTVHDLNVVTEDVSARVIGEGSGE